MPRTGATIYDLLLSCPGDVIDLKEIVKECADDFNRIHGKVNNVQIEVRHWSTDSFPQSGGGAQQLLNEQFIHDCDACIALFANKFGSPTDRFESGTEEEIEDMINAGKQVFLYFIERPIDPSSIDAEQLGKVRKFKDKYADRGIYWIVKSNEDFRKMLSNHLSLYFLTLITQPIDTNNIIVRTPKLEFLMSDGSDTAKVLTSNYQNLRMLKKREELIRTKIADIKSIEIKEYLKENTILDETTETKGSDSIPNTYLNSQLSNQLQQLSKLNSTFKNIPGFQQSEYKKVDIDEETKKLIVKFCKGKNIDIEDSFWNLGSLKKEFKPFILPYGNEPLLKGTEEEKTKYESINDLWVHIYEYQDYNIFLSELDKLFQLSCIIANKGSTFDEDIDVKLRIPKGHILKAKDIPLPGMSCIEEINNNGLCEILFCGRETDQIEAYSNYPVQTYFPHDLPMEMYPFNRVSATEQYEKDKKKYLDNLDRIFCYDYYQVDEYDVLVFNIKYLKQNINMYIPSKLLFKYIPEYIEFEIRSKHLPDVTSGRIEVTK